MVSAYIHIPFCRKACRYCDFFFTVSMRYMEDFTTSLVEEIRQRASQEGKISLESLYLGGGTPSMLRKEYLERIMEEIRCHFSITEDAEITIECNPDDLDRSNLSRLKRLGFNRLSIGIQSFHQRDLELLNRSHDTIAAERSVKLAASEGFKNITADLIYGIPGQTTGEWEENLDKLLALPVDHLSAYHLTFEEGTVFDHWRKKGRIEPVTDEYSLNLYQVLREKMESFGFEHYEISNFARKGYRSVHNSRYWSGKPYLGFGPSAHSFDGNARSWNISSLKIYMDGIMKGIPVSEREVLGTREMYHDFLIMKLRTREGIEKKALEQEFGEKINGHFRHHSARFVQEGVMVEEDDRVFIDPAHWMLSDHVVRELFLADQ
jgi:oxygen-independent coproporphyrinogen-3 oxidase